jgi:GcrA cell cycle regulator
MTINWDGDHLDFTHNLWAQINPTISVSKIAEICSTAWGEEVSKNAIVGKAHRQGWDSRPSPIKPGPGWVPGVPRRELCPPPGGYTALPKLPSLKAEPPAEPVAAPAPEPQEAAQCPTRRMRDPGAPLYRRDGTGCLAVGCGAPLYSVIKPYCDSCASKFYTNRKRGDLYAED